LANYILAKSNLEGKIELLEDDFSKDFGEYAPMEIEVFKFKQFEEENIKSKHGP